MPRIERFEYGERVFVQGYGRRTFFAYAGNGEVVVVGGEQFPSDQVMSWMQWAIERATHAGVWHPPSQPSRIGA